MRPGQFEFKNQEEIRSYLAKVFSVDHKISNLNGGTIKRSANIIHTSFWYLLLSLTED